VRHGDGRSLRIGRAESFGAPAMKNQTEQLSACRSRQPKLPNLHKELRMSRYIFTCILAVAVFVPFAACGSNTSEQPLGADAGTTDSVSEGSWAPGPDATLVLPPDAKASDATPDATSVDAPPVAVRYRPTTATWPRGSWLYFAGLTVSYQYDAEGKMIREENSDGSYYSYTYDSLGHPSVYEYNRSVRPSENFRRIFTYDAAGVVAIDLQTRNGINERRVINTISDGAITEYEYYDWNVSMSAWTFSYSAKNMYNSKKQITKITSADFYGDYEYDDRGNLNKTRLYRRNSSTSPYYPTFGEDSVFDTNKVYRRPVQAFREISNNNVISLTEMRYSPDGTFTSASVTYSYDANDQGYVTKAHRNGTLEVSYALEKW
jgi:YD repeat-containing protein